MLFIDEAYSLASNEYGKQVAATLVPLLEKYRKRGEFIPVGVAQVPTRARAPAGIQTSLLRYEVRLAIGVGLNSEQQREMIRMQS